MGKTAIEWTDDVWNPTVGCTRVSPGCARCYAFTLHDRRHAAYKSGKRVPAQYAKPFNEIQLMPDRLKDPLHWLKPRRVFVNSVSDLFHESIPDEFIDRVFAVMAMCPQHTFQVLTKRAQRMRDYMRMVQDNEKDLQRFANVACEIAGSPCAAGIFDEVDWPFPNVWLGVSIEDQQRADERIPLLLDAPVAVRWLSCEPLLGSLDLSRFFFVDDERYPPGGRYADEPHTFPKLRQDGIGWVVVGGESGPKARPMHPDWARSIRDQCQAAGGVPFFMKQWGEWAPLSLTDPWLKCSWGTLDADGQWFPNTTPWNGHEGDDSPTRECVMLRVGKKRAGRLLDGREWNEFPNNLREPTPSAAVSYPA